MNICGIACIKDSHALLAASIRHLYLNGIKDFYLYDHGSEPALSSYLMAEFGVGTIRLHVLRKETHLFFHRQMINALADLAREDGFGIAVAFDADEFWCSTVPGRSLCEQIAFEMSPDIDALQIPVINYLQHRDVDAFEADSLAHCQYSAIPFVDPTRQPWEQVDAGLPFAAIPFPAKAIAWLSQDNRYTTGMHSITKTQGSPRMIDAEGIVMRHLPMPCRRQISERREHGRRFIASGRPPGVGWQSQRLAQMSDEELDTYWNNNAWHLTDDHRACAGTYDRLVRDDALVLIGQALKASGQQSDQTIHPGIPAAETFHDIPSRQLERVIECLIDDYGQDERTIEALRIAHDQAIAERDSARRGLSEPRSRSRGLFHFLRPLEKKLREFRKRHFARNRLSLAVCKQEPEAQITWCVLQADSRPSSFHPESKRLAYDSRDDSVEMMHRLNAGTLVHTWDYWSSSALINRLKCVAMKCEYRRVSIHAGDHADRHITWGKIRALSNFLRDHPGVDIVAFLDSDAFVRDEARFIALVEALARNPDKHGIFSRDPLMAKNTFINTGCMILKNDAFVKQFLENVWSDVKANPKYRWEWPHEQYAASVLVESGKDAFYVCRTSVLNTPCGEIVRHSWWKDLFEELMVDELKSSVAKMLDPASSPKTGFNLDELLDR